ncbi:RNA-directed DNA polymerase [Pseudomonas sp. B21-053]|uniref:RNA-directed DNA polymerase n=1 Tax=Pseudomonas sp. B21-053 TaxID=2895493 RepID=UPI0022328548|nr:RNA-directed DNA polymerase [Pseudomonas sp. B21-053]UZE14341.1 RNA-directed DNA polymerase [Pseudomonas sp. B21-053]
MLTDDSLEFARNHITSFYDTDFYPKPFEFSALWHSWAEVKIYLINTSLAQAHTTNPRVLPWAKARGGYRIVHQLEPLDSIIYTALVYLAAENIESSRMDSSTACSYRIEVDDNSFFAKGSGFSAYRESCERLGQIYEYVLSTDISDFYNQIYLHRVGNIIDSVGAPEGLGKAIENFLSRLNNKASQGIPVGPAASIILAEAVLIDVDQFISNHHVEHVRYVDDFRIFSDSKDQLSEILENLVVYLHDQHRLGLVSEKTSIRTAEEFLHEELQNQYQMEKLEILNEIEAGNQYGAYESDGDDEFESEEEEYDAGDYQWMGADEDGERTNEAEDIGGALLDALIRARNFGYVDLAVLRAIIRRAKYAQTPSLAEFLLNDIDFYTPIINDVCLYLISLSQGDLKPLVPLLSNLCRKSTLQKRSVRVWMEWLFTRDAIFLTDQNIRRYAYEGAVSSAASGALVQKNIAWSKEAKQKVLTSASWDRRSYIHSLKNLSKDETKKYIDFIKRNPSLTHTDKWICEWVIAGYP